MLVDDAGDAEAAELHLPAEEVGTQQPAVLVRHVDHVDLRHVSEERREDAPRAAVAGRGIVDDAGLLCAAVMSSLIELTPSEGCTVIAYGWPPIA